MGLGIGGGIMVLLLFLVLAAISGALGLAWVHAKNRRPSELASVLLHETRPEIPVIDLSRDVGVSLAQLIIEPAKSVEVPPAASTPLIIGPSCLKPLVIGPAKAITIDPP